MSLIDDLTLLKAELQVLPSEFGLPQYSRQLRLKKEILNAGSFVPTVSWVLISPNPRIENVPEKMVGLEFSNNTIFLSADDFIIKEIPRTYTFNQLKDNVESYVIGGTAPDFIDGIRCQLVHISDKKSLSWELILKRKVDKE